MKILYINKVRKYYIDLSYLDAEPTKFKSTHLAVQQNDRVYNRTKSKRKKVN